MQRTFGILLAAAVAAFSLAQPAAARDHDDWRHDRDIHHFHDRDFGRWHAGHWYHGRHGNRMGWWWIVGGAWYFYPAPVYPYPDPYIPPVVAPAPGPAHFWYFCDRPRGYYPYVATCRVPWRAVPAR